MISHILLFEWKLGGTNLTVRAKFRLGAEPRLPLVLYARASTMKIIMAHLGTSQRLLAQACNQLRLYAMNKTSLSLKAREKTNFSFGANLMSITSNLTFFRGEDITLDFQMSPPVDVTGWTISFKVADTIGGTVQFTKSASIIDGPRGKWRVSIASADTSALTVGRYVWDARRTDSGSKATLADGYIDLRREVTA